MAGVSPDLIWQVVRTHHSALVTRGGHRFSREKFNLSNKHSFSSSGFASPAGVDVNVSKSGITLAAKSTRHTSPAATKSGVLSKGFRSGARTVKRVAGGARHDLSHAAIARFSQLKHASHRPALAGVKKPRRRNLKK